MQRYVSIYLQNSKELEDLVKAIRKALEPHACTKKPRIPWTEIERLMDIANEIKFERKPPDIVSGLNALIDSWKFDKFLYTKVKEFVGLMPHTFVDFKEFRKNMGALFEKVTRVVVEESKKYTRFIHLLEHEGKSEFWMFLCFLAHCKYKAPEVYKILKSNLKIYNSNQLYEYNARCVLYNRDSCFLFFDDVSYSGSQMALGMQEVASVSKGKIVVGVVYASPASIRKFQQIQKEYDTSITVLNSGIIQSLSTKQLKWLDDNEVLFYTKKGLAPYRAKSLWIVMAARSPCRTFFEHKVADRVSLPAYMSTPLWNSSPIVLKQAKVVEYEANGVTYPLPRFTVSEQTKINNMAWLYGDFCDRNKRTGETYMEYDCFKPEYKTNKLEIRSNVK